jgi:hypothetical protein
MMRMVLLFALLALLGACDPDVARVCPAEVRPALQVAVVDAATGANLAAGAVGWWVTGSFAGALDDTDPTSPDNALTAYGPAGRYSLIVQHPGYRPWGRDDIRVNRGECSVRTVQLRVEMHRDVTVGGAGAD